MVRVELGLDPWDVFHQGLSDRLPLTFGQVTIMVGALVLLGWIPLRQRPGLGTISNVIVIGLAVDAALAAIPPGSDDVAYRVTYLSGVVCSMQSQRPPTSVRASGLGRGTA